MADVKFAVTRFGTSTLSAGNTQDVTIPGFGTPKAVLFFLSRGITDDVAVDDASLSIGAIDGTRQWVVSAFSEDGQATTDTRRSNLTDACITWSSSAAQNLEMSFNSWITDGVRLDIDSTNTGAELLCSCVFIGGADVSNAYVNFKDDLGTGTGAVDITDPGFEPDLVFVTTTGQTVSDGNNIHTILSFGCGHNDGSDTQRFTGLSSKDQSANAVVSGYVSNTKVTGQIFDDSASWLGAIGSYDSSGFSITPSSSSSNDVVFYLALELANSPDVSLFDMSWPTSGNYAETGPGFEPNFGLLVSSPGVSSRNAVSTSGGEGLAITAFDDSSIYTQTYTDEDGAATSVAKSLSADRLRILGPDGSTDAVVASGYAFDSQGWDFTLTTNPSSTVLGWGLAIGAGAGGGTTVSAALEGITLSTFQASVSVETSITAALESLALTEFPAQVSAGTDIAAQPEAITLSQLSAEVSAGNEIAAQTESLTLDALPATVSAGSGIGAQIESISLTVNPASVSAGTTLQAALEPIELSAFSASVTSGANIGANLESIVLTPQAGTVSAATELAAALEQISLATYGADVELDLGVDAGLEPIILAPQPATIELAVTINATQETFSLSTFAAQVGLGADISALTESIVLTPQGVTLVFETVVQANLEQLQLQTFSAAVTSSESVLTAEGKEYTLPVARFHDTIRISKIHFTIREED